MRARLCPGVVACLIAAHAAAAAAQTDRGAASEPLQLPALQREALGRDARARELELLAEQTALRVRNIEAERLPSVSVLGQSQYQSDVPTAPFALPNGQPAFAASKDTYDASLRVDQRIVDPAASARLAVARADLAESQARVRTTLFALRTEVNDAFFAAALLQEQLRALAATIDDLESRLRETTARVREGTAVPSEAAAIEATVLQQRQRADELRASRRAAIARIAAVTGRAIGDEAVVLLPQLDEPVAAARRGLDRLRARPEYEQFDRARDRAAREQDLALAQDRPQISAFGRVGYGKPGLNFVSSQFETYALGGVQLQWKAWSWGSAGRERDALALQQTIVTAEETAFTDGLRRAIQPDLETIDRLQTALAADDRIVALREGIQRVSELRLREGVVTAAEYLDRETERLGAQFDRARHVVELAQARARVLTMLGLEVQ
jgi:outer membrane protein TolC